MRLYIWWLTAPRCWNYISSVWVNRLWVYKPEGFSRNVWQHYSRSGWRNWSTCRISCEFQSLNQIPSCCPCSLSFVDICVQAPKPLIFSQCNPLFIGISRRRLNVRPAAFFFIKCSLQSNEIQQLYSTAQDGYESTQLFAVSMVCSTFYKKKEISFQSYIAKTWLIFVLECYALLFSY